ncbi:MAG: hypothetical protein DCF19_16495 [Pseudanabaena frigida]|uniref:DUF4139 domain-containing protein n=1 Tax=Pseudanabaena frigida TaxID=945775 RepID=A0A2W4W2K1_9CYAN|nr:MAG: hypothetical protein DCF19_16495 [Pseudanabaena frigida]
MTIAQLTSKIDKVKVYAEGSTVTRLASLSAIAWQSETEVEIVGLPLALDDATVRVRVESGAADNTDGDNIFVTDVRVGLSVPPPTEVPVSSLETEIQTAKAEVDRLEDLRSAIGLEILILNELQVPDRPVGEEGKAPPQSPTGARLALANFKDEQRQLRIKEKRELEVQLRKGKESLDDLQQKQTLASNANVAKIDELRKTIIARLHVSDRPPESLPSPDTLQLVVEYFVRGARWMPTYVCRLNSVTNTAAIAVRALICQRTGEDWSGVKIELSTATPTGWCELPELPSLRLGRSQTISSKKAWRSPPQGAEILFEDYDLQKQHADNTARTAIFYEPFIIPTVDRLIGIQESTFAKQISSLGTTFLGEILAGSSLPSPAPAGNDEFYNSFGASVAAPAAPASTQMSVRSPQSLAKAKRSSPQEERFEQKSLASRGRSLVAQSAESVDAELAALRSELGGGFTQDLATIFNANQEIKNYGLMRLAAPSDTSQRGKLNIPDAKTLYLESLERWKITVKCELTTVLQSAFGLAMHLPVTGVNVRQLAGAFDFAYLGNGRIDIPADGQFHSVALLEENAEIDLRYIVVPREDTNVFRVAQLRNPLRAPLLSGSTDVYVDGEYILTTRIATVPPKGQMELSLGVEQAIKVARNTSFKEVRSGMSLVAFNELRHKIHIAIANRLSRVAQIEVRERVPVPQPDTKVDVTVTQVTPVWEKYEQQERNIPIKGGYRWQVNVPSCGEVELTADYTIKTFVDNELVDGNRREE